MEEVPGLLLAKGATVAGPISPCGIAHCGRHAGCTAAGKEMQF
jgi:hypothetical protein